MIVKEKQTEIFIHMSKWKDLPKPWTFEQNQEFMKEIVDATNFIDLYFEWHDKVIRKATAEEILNDGIWYQNAHLNFVRNFLKGKHGIG